MISAESDDNSETADDGKIELAESEEAKATGDSEPAVDEGSDGDSEVTEEIESAGRRPIY